MHFALRAFFFIIAYKRIDRLKIIYLIPIALLILTACSSVNTSNNTLIPDAHEHTEEYMNNPLPSYVVTSREVEKCDRPRVLREPAKKIQFPLSEEVKQQIILLEKKYDAEENMAGLAAVQIGFDIRAIIFGLEPTPEIRSHRKDISDTMPRTLWLNPEYKGIKSEGRSIDYEACFSVENLVGRVARYNAIYYNAQLPDGKTVKGEARGFLARIIQHEIDHLDGVLFVDLIENKEQDLFTQEEWKEVQKSKR